MQSIRMMEKKGLALFLLSLSSVAGFAQSQIRGNVKDSNGEPILGATVKVNGSKVAIACQESKEERQDGA